MAALAYLWYIHPKQLVVVQIKRLISTQQTINVSVLSHVLSSLFVFNRLKIPQIPVLN